MIKYSVFPQTEHNDEFNIELRQLFDAFSLSINADINFIRNNI